MGTVGLPITFTWLYYARHMHLLMDSLFAGPSLDPLPAHTQRRRLRPATAHRDGRSQRRLPPGGADGGRVSRLPAQDGQQVQDVEQTLVRLQSNEALVYILHERHGIEGARRDLLPGYRGGVRRPSEECEKSEPRADVLREDIRPRVLSGRADGRGHADMDRRYILGRRGESRIRIVCCELKHAHDIPG